MIDCKKKCKSEYEFEDTYFKIGSNNFDKLLDIQYPFEKSINILFKIYSYKNVKIPKELQGWSEAVENWT